MLSSLWLLKLASVFLWAAVAFLIWNILIRPLLMEKVFSLILAFLALSFWLFLNGLEFLPLVILLLYIGAISVLFLFVVMIINPDFTDLLQQKQQLVAQLQQRQAALAALMNHHSSNNTLLSLDEQQKLATVLTSEINRDNNSNRFKNSSYFSFFFFSLLAGSFFGGLFSWYQYVALKFTLALTSVNKVLQIYSISQIEESLASQAGMLQQLGFLPLSEFKIQSLYHPALSENNEMVNIGLLLYTKYGVALIIVGLMLLVSMIGAIVLTLRQTTFVKRQGIGMQLVRYAV